MKITYSIDWERGIDPYRRDTGGQTVPTMYLIIGDDIHVVVEQNNPGQTGIWTEEFQYVNVSVALRDEYGNDITPDAEVFDQYIRSPEATELIERIAAGYDTEWSGRQPGDGYLQAALDEDAYAALQELEAAIDALPDSTIVWWNVEEWFGQADWRGMSGGEVDEWIADPVGQDGDTVGLTEDPTDYILKQVAFAIEDELSMTNAPANLLAVRDIFVIVNRDEDGDIEAVLAVMTPAGHYWERDGSEIPPLTVSDLAHGFHISQRAACALAKRRHEKQGIGQQLPGGQWVFLPRDLATLRPDPKYRAGIGR